MTLLTLNNPRVTKTMWLDIWGLGLDGRLSAQVKYNGIWVLYNEHERDGRCRVPRYFLRAVSSMLYSTYIVKSVHILLQLLWSILLPLIVNQPGRVDDRQ